MLIANLHERFHIRGLEWLAASVMIGIGLHLAVWPDTFLRAGLIGFTEIAPMNVWIVASIAFGLIRIGALVLNGHNSQLSAPVRFVGAALGGGLFTAVLVAYLGAWTDQGPPLAAVFAFSLLCCEAYSAIRSGRDAYHALSGGEVWIPR